MSVRNEKVHHPASAHERGEAPDYLRGQYFEADPLHDNQAESYKRIRGPVLVLKCGKTALQKPHYAVEIKNHEQAVDHQFEDEQACPAPSTVHGRHYYIESKLSGHVPQSWVGGSSEKSRDVPTLSKNVSHPSAQCLKEVSQLRIKKSKGVRLSDVRRRMNYTVGVVAKGELNRGFEYAGIVGPDAAGESVLDYLARRFPRFGREEWAARIESHRVLLDGQPADPDTAIRPPQKLVWLRPPWREPEAPLCFAVLYRDEDLLAVAKPDGLPTVPGGGFLEHTLLHLVRRTHPEAGPMHRLGRGTSGIVLFTRTPEASRKVSEAWRQGEVLKIYRALASGFIEKDEFRIDVPIGPVPHAVLGRVYAAVAGGKPSLSHVRVLKRDDGKSIVQVKITTGRSHQIRIHMAAAGHPLAGDRFYAAGGVPTEGTNALPGDVGYCLHAEQLSLIHPRTGQWLVLTCAPPPPLRT
jgi:23S rRNA pseudouridine1911/1915/1917 synthase